MNRTLQAAERRAGVGGWVLLLALCAVGSISIVAVNLAHLRAGWAAALSFSGSLLPPCCSRGEPKPRSSSSAAASPSPSSR
jgi:hypothetical protein